jgi:hypothetical protein
MPRKPPRKRKGPHNPIDDGYLLELWDWTYGLPGNPRSSKKNPIKKKFARLAKANYYQKGIGPGEQANIDDESIVRHLNRLLRERERQRRLGNPDK